MTQAALSRLSADDYLRQELRSPIKHEYVDGQIFAMAGATQRHNLIVGNIFAPAKFKGRERNCRVFAADMRVQVAARNSFYYPDVAATCDQADKEELYLARPCLIVEVLSPSTAATDRREKRLAYCALGSLREYWLVDQDRRSVEIYRRADSGWTVENLDTTGVVESGCLGLRLSLDEIYEGVEIPPAVAEPTAQYSDAPSA